MSYVDGFVAPVLLENREKYRLHAERMAAVFKQYGALRVAECWQDDVPDGKLTSFPISVQRAEGEAVVFSWVEWPSKEVRDAGWAKMMSDPAMAGDEPMPFDGKRMIYGGFQMMVDL